MQTLNDLFETAGEHMAGNIKQALHDSTFCLIAGGIENPGISRWLAFPSMVSRYVSQLLDIRLGDVLAGAWNKARAVKRSLEKSTKDPGKEILLELAEHKIMSKHEPYLELLRNGVRVATLKFNVDLELTLQGAVLRILDGKIKDVQVGQIKGKGTIKGGGAILLEKSIGPIEIPGTIALAG
jgi:hypothetical protein